MGANLKEVRERIKSVISTQQITKAMKMVSAAKLRRAQTAITQLRPYAGKLNSMLVNIMSNLDGDSDTVYGIQRPVEKVLIVIVTSNRGLAGAFNTNVIKAATGRIDSMFTEQRAKGNLSFLCIGKKGADYVKRHFPDCKIITQHVGLFNDLSFDNVAAVATEIMEGFASKQYDLVEVSYSRFRNAAMQFAEIEQFLPVAKLEVKGKKSRADYIFEPDQAELLEYLIPSILQTSFQKFLLDTHASEHGARMTAMDKATENADGLLTDLKIHYNKARQEAITKELSEIVGGAAALGG